MAQMNLPQLLLLALAVGSVVAQRAEKQPGGVYQQTCRLNNQRYLTQFYRDKVQVKIYNSVYTAVGLYIISENTTVNEETLNSTDRYSLQQVGSEYTLSIKDLLPSDSGFYGCRLFDVERNRTWMTQDSTELFVPGPIMNLRWTADVYNETTRREEIPDGGIHLTGGGRPSIGCLVDVTNVQPEVSITLGRYGQPGTVNITHQYRHWLSSTSRLVSGGYQMLSTVTFERSFEFSQRSIRDVYCRASVPGTTLEKSVNIQVRSKPDNKPCHGAALQAQVGAVGVNLTCLVEAHPAAGVTWITPHGAPLTELSNNSNYTVTNSERFEGVFTTLTITKVTSKQMYGRYIINATNTEGTGTKYVTFKEGAAGIMRSSVSLITSMVSLLLWVLN